MKVLKLSHYSPLNTVLSDAESGELLYRISTPCSVFRGTTTVLQYVDDSPPVIYRSHNSEMSWDMAVAGLKEVARIHWHFMSGTWVVYNLQIIDMNSLFPATNVMRM